MNTKFEQYLERNDMWNFEGDTGVRKFGKLVGEVCGYDNITSFLADNPGVMEVIVEWISNEVDNGGEWQENLTDLIPNDEE